MVKRDLPINIVLTFLTCGIFGAIWFFMLLDETNTYTGKPSNIAVDILLCIVTCGIYSFFLNYKLGSNIDEMLMSRYGQHKSFGVLLLVISIFSLGWLGIILAQHEVNSMIDSDSRKTSSDDDSIRLQ